MEVRDSTEHFQIECCHRAGYRKNYHRLWKVTQTPGIFYLFFQFNSVMYIFEIQIMKIF